MVCEQRARVSAWCVSRLFAVVCIVTVCCGEFSESLSLDAGSTEVLPQPGQCRGIPAQGCCDGTTLIWCESGKIQEVSCTSKPVCGWNGQVGSYDCGTDGGEDPTGVFPISCQATQPPESDASGLQDVAVLVDAMSPDGEPGLDVGAFDEYDDSSGGQDAPAPIDTVLPEVTPDVSIDVANCGDGVCDDVAEECQSCPADCGECPQGCGNGVCAAVENCQNCPLDCGVCPPLCGDGECNGQETVELCPQDCADTGPECGNGQCEAGESAANCPADCGGGGGLTCAQIVDCLGENQCEDEQCFQNCIEQGSTTAQGQFMAVLTCFQNSGCPETDQACLQQACAAQLEACGGGGGPAECGNGTCEQGETPDSCPADCGGGGACGDIDYVGLCEGNIVKWCEGGAIQQIDCSQGGPQCVCGFKEDAGFYDCTGQCG